MEFKASQNLFSPSSSSLKNDQQQQQNHPNGSSETSQPPSTSDRKAVSTEIKTLLTGMFGPFDEYQKYAAAQKQYNSCPFLSPERYVDKKRRLKKMSHTIDKNRQLQKGEVYRIRVEEEAKESLEREKAVYQKWNDRRKNYQARFSLPFTEPKPKVSQQVMEYFEKKDMEDLY